ncbi:MAG TPA: L,D-transpeptidase family protein [Longimicrobium sp.]|nr:L,D-transpeptidase family protein [Longimicrobium sp.]
MKRIHIIPLLALGAAAISLADVQAQAQAAVATSPPAQTRPAAVPPASSATTRRAPAAVPARGAAPQLAGRPAQAASDSVPSTDSAATAAVTTPAGKPSDWVTGLVRTPAASPAEDAASGAVRRQAFAARGRRVIVSLADRHLWYMDGRDTLRSAPVAVGKGTRLEYGSQAWRFNTPRGVRRVQEKRANPVWTPPEWHYAEIARDSGWTVARLQRGVATRLRDGGRLLVRGDRIVHQDARGGEEIIPEDEEIIFGNTIYVPPEDTRNRRIPGELGAYALGMGSGYLLHGTPHQDSIGQAATHGCIRLRDEDIEYLYRNVPVGTPVYIF